MRRKLYIKYDVEPNMYENIKYEIHTSDAFVLGFKELTS